MTFVNPTVCHQAIFIKTNLFNKFGIYNQKLNIVADWKFLIETIILNICTYKYIDKEVCWYDLTGISSNEVFNGYVFVKSLTSQNDAVLQTKGVVNFVRYIGKIAIIRVLEIDRLKQIVNLGYHIETNFDKQAFKLGDRVKVHSGPLKGIEGLVLENNQERFIELALEGIGQNIKVKLTEELLELVHE